MAAEKLLAEWFWVDRWVGSSAFLLPLEARGLYREMLTQAWRRGAQLPNDPEAIQRAVGCTKKEWARSWSLIEKYWRVEGDTLVNDTQLDVYADAQARMARTSERARKAAEARWAADAQALAQASAHASAQAKPAHCPPNSDHRTPNSDPVPKTEPIARAWQKTPIIGRNAHLTHALCDETHAYCVPAAVHQKLAGVLAPKFGGDYDKAAEALLDWYPTVWATLAAGFVMGEAFKFWQAQFDAAFASKTTLKIDPKDDRFYNAVNDDAVWAAIVKEGPPK